MDYKKAYEEAMEIVRSFQEKEDERIRKELIEYHRRQARMLDEERHIRWAEWLEKLGEIKPNNR